MATTNIVYLTIESWLLTRKHFRYWVLIRILKKLIIDEVDFIISSNDTDGLVCGKYSFNRINMLWENHRLVSNSHTSIIYTTSTGFEDQGSRRQGKVNNFLTFVIIIDDRRYLVVDVGFVYKDVLSCSTLSPMIATKCV